jgi:hypothetical protein
VDDATLFDWLRYYARVIVLITAAGALFAGFVYLVNPREYEARTIMVSTGASIPPRSFGSVAIVLSRSSAVYDDAAERLGTTGTNSDFFRIHSEVISVPGSNVMLVVGRAENAAEAREISQALAGALAEAFEERAGNEIQTFARPERSESRQGFSIPVTIALGGVAGFLAGLAVAIVLYRRRRPVLSLLRASSMLGARQVAIFDPKGHMRMSRLRPNRSLELVARNLRYRLEDPSETGHFTKSQSVGDTDEYVVVAHKATPERELVLYGLTATAVPASHGPKLLWIR